ncbi:MAG: large subunit ribosomal protein, partial [Thermoproteota archaeon]|nr:large subunit ribosomal protein [Thermoproteota archaeon]
MSRLSGDSAMSKQNRMIIIDASNLILGRLSSIVAKRLLTGESVIVVNAEKAVISGSRASIIDGYKKRLEIRTLGSKEKSPKHPRRPEGLIRKTVRGMLPWHKPKGKNAYKRLKVYVGVPDDFKGLTLQIEPRAKASSEIPLTTIEEVA